MVRTIIILIALALWPLEQRAQQVFANELLALEEKIYAEQDDSVKNLLLIQKTDLCILNNDFSEDALNTANRVKTEKIADSAELKRFLWNAALMAHLNGNYYRAGAYIEKYFQATGDSDATAMLLSVLIQAGTDTAKVSRALAVLQKKDSSAVCLKCLNEVEKYSRKGKGWYVFFSRILPGSGSMMNGNVFKGVVSLVIFSAAAVGVYALVVNHLYVNAVLWGLPAISKFYGGNVRLTKKLFDIKEARKKNKLANNCELELNKVLKKHPLNFR